MAQRLVNPTSIHEDAGPTPGLDQWAKELALLWLWCRPAATAVIRPLVWEPPYAAGVALKRQNTKQKQKQKKERIGIISFFFFAFFFCLLFPRHVEVPRLSVKSEL